MQPLVRRTLLLISLTLILAACTMPGPGASLAQDPSGPLIVTANPRATRTPTPFQPLIVTPTSTPLPTYTPSATPAPTLTPPPTATAAPTQIVVTPTARPQYLVNTTVDYFAHTVNVDEKIGYTNQSSDSLSQLVLAVEPNFWPGGFVLSTVSINGVVDYDVSLSSHQMTISLPQPLAPGQAIAVGLSFQLNVPVKATGLIYGYTDYQMNLVDWFPFIVPYLPGQGWVLHDAYPWGENLVYNSADFEVELRFADPSSAPIVAASAPAEANGEWTRYRLYGARTFSFSMSPYFDTYQAASSSGVNVTSYCYTGYGAACSAIAQTGAQAVSVYSSTFGPYPYSSLAIVETIIPDGMETDGLVFLNTQYWARYDGTLSNELTTLGVHEIAHQWWFGQVGNDQALEPWLDEALGVYSEHIFYENTAPGLLNWWWNYRVLFFKPSGWVDTTVFGGGSFRTYVNAVYLNGALFLQDLRDRIGDGAFFAFLADYAARNDRRIATSSDFFAILREHTDANINDLISAYFQSPH
jgi:hypothetical protein